MSEMTHGLWETLDGAFPKAIMPDGLARALQIRIRKKIRDIGWAAETWPGPTWVQTVESFFHQGARPHV